MSVQTLLSKSLSGSRSAVKVHLKRAKYIARTIEDQWNVWDPQDWKCKHVHWFLNHHLVDRSSATRYDYWCTVSRILAALEKLEHWAPRLRGPWLNKQGITWGQRPRGAGGRPMKLPRSSER